MNRPTSTVPPLTAEEEAWLRWDIDAPDRAYLYRPRSQDDTFLLSDNRRFARADGWMARRLLANIDALRKVAVAAQAREDAEEAAADYETELNENWSETGEHPNDEQNARRDRLANERAESILTVRAALNELERASR